MSMSDFKTIDDQVEREFLMSSAFILQNLKKKTLTLICVLRYENRVFPIGAKYKLFVWILILLSPCKKVLLSVLVRNKWGHYNPPWFFSFTNY